MILTDSEEIAGYAFDTLKRYLDFYESKPADLPVLANLVSFLCRLAGCPPNYYNLKSETHFFAIIFSF